MPQLLLPAFEAQFIVPITHAAVFVYFLLYKNCYVFYCLPLTVVCRASVSTAEADEELRNSVEDNEPPSQSQQPLDKCSRQ